MLCKYLCHNESRNNMGLFWKGRKQSRKKWRGTGGKWERKRKDEEFSTISMCENAMMEPIILYGNQSIDKVDYKK